MNAKNSKKNREMTKLEAHFEGFWSALRLPLSTVLYNELPELFPELQPFYQQTGIQDLLIEQQRSDLGLKILSEKSLQLALNFAKQGIPTGLRSKFWDFIIQSELIDDLNSFVSSFLLQYKNYFFIIKIESSLLQKA
jgi:hypothetical protein